MMSCLLEKYNEIWDKVSNSMKKGLDCEPAYNEVTSAEPEDQRLKVEYNETKI